MEDEASAEAPTPPVIPWHTQNELSRADLPPERTKTANSAAHSSIVGDGGYAKQLAHSTAATHQSSHDYDENPAVEDDLQHIGGGIGSKQPIDDALDEDSTAAEPELHAPDGLERCLRMAMVDSAGKEATEKRFVPVDEIDRIVNLKSVLRELKTVNLGQDQDPNGIAHQICSVHEGKSPLDGKETKTNRRRIFATLALIRETAAIQEVLREDLYDWDLPLALDTTDRGHHRLARRNADGSLRLVSFSRSWSPYQHEAFSRCQWQLSSPCFEMRTNVEAKIMHYRLDAHSILPITRIDGEDRYGAFSNVSKIKLHPAHRKSLSPDQDSNSLHSWLALKRLQFSTEAAFKAELTPLIRLGNNQNSHIVQLLTTFQYRNECNLVLEWADGGNLFDFWQSFPQHYSPARDYGLGKWLATQLTGLASALSLIHKCEFNPQAANISRFNSQDIIKKYGAHSDVKPENILWFKASPNYEDPSNLGTFKLSDIDLVSFDSLGIGEELLPARRFFLPAGISATYRAPECDLDRHISLKYDMWSLGCVLLEHLTWYLLGYEGVTAFSQRRMRESQPKFREDSFFNMSQNLFPLQRGRAIMKICVQEQFNLLRETPNCSDFLSDILDFVQDKLLQMSPVRRCEVSEFLHFTKDASQKCMEDETYCTQRLKPIKIRNDVYVPKLHEQFLLRTGQHKMAVYASVNRSRTSVHMKAIPSATRGAEPLKKLPVSPVREEEITEEQAAQGRTAGEPEPTTALDYLDSSYYSRVAESIEFRESFGSPESAHIPESTRPTEFSRDILGQEAPNLHDAPTEYSASNRTDLPPLQEAYISEFAQTLFQRLREDGLSINGLEQVSTVLADSLKGFASRLGLDAQAQMQRDIVYFAHKSRRKIQDAFEWLLFRERRKMDAQMPFKDKVGEWKWSPGLLPLDNGPEDIPPDFELPDTPISATAEDEDPVSDDEIPEIEDNELSFQQYRDTIHRSSAYGWLLGTLRREATLQPADQDQMKDTRTRILRSFTEAPRISRNVSYKAHKATFILEWDPWEFVKYRDPRDIPEKALLGAITLTGSPDNAQAITCSEYLTQTWPSNGKGFARLLINLVRTVPGDQCRGTLADGTLLTAVFDGRMTVITTVGVADSIAEVGQQLAWTGAALRFAPLNVEMGLHTCSSSINGITWKHKGNESELIIEMNFRMEKLTAGTDILGGCWHNMLKNPVLVTGFPTMAKPMQEFGIEMPLDIMACLTGSRRVIEFDGKVIMKGFSTMLTAVKRSEGFLTWHYTFHKDKSRMPFFEALAPESDGIHLGLLETSRHIIGWCSSAKYYAGGAEAKHNIQESGLPPPSNGCILDRISLSAGKGINVNASFSRPVTNLPPHLTLDGYAQSLLYLEEQFVVMWDEGDKRGWLVNGTSALLHLVRVHLRNIASGNCRSLFEFDVGDITEAVNKYHPRMSATEVLCHKENRGLVVGEGRTERYQEQKTTGERSETTKTLKENSVVFEAFVEHFMSYLEQIMDHQIRLAGIGGLELKAHARRRLEGWDFMNILNSKFPRPCVTELHSLGWGWVDFVRSINAVTLFGRGFGDLITPAEPQLVCPDWQILPKGRYYLAASAVDLMAAMKMHGNRYSSPPQLVHGLAWHSPASCACAGARSFGKKHYDPVQVLLPSASKHILKMEGPSGLGRHDTAAFVLGHNFSKPLRWFDGSSLPELVQETEESSIQFPQHTPEASPEIATRLIGEQMTYTQATDSSSSTGHGMGTSSIQPDITSASSVEVPPGSENVPTKSVPIQIPTEGHENQQANAVGLQPVSGDPPWQAAQASVSPSSRSRPQKMWHFISRQRASLRSLDSAITEPHGVQPQTTSSGIGRTRRFWRRSSREKKD